MKTLLAGIVSGVVSGLVVYLIQFIVASQNEKIKNRESKRVGRSRTYKFVDEDFIYNYLPENLLIERIFEDFGQPDKKMDDSVTLKWDNNKIKKLTEYQYKFINAVILFSTFKNESYVISVTINSNQNKSHPVKFCFGFTEEDVCFGQAKINEEILNAKVNFESQSFINWAYASIKAKFFYREIKDLTFTYIVCDIVESESNMLGKTIDQLCISANEDVSPVIYFYDMI